MREENSGLYPEILHDVSAIFGLHFPIVLDSYRDLEALTAERAFTSRQNLLEALSHLAVLFGRAAVLDRDEQLAQVAHISDHLRRVLMEGFEKQAYVVLGRIRAATEDGRQVFVLNTTSRLLRLSELESFTVTSRRMRSRVVPIMLYAGLAGLAERRSLTALGTIGRQPPTN